MRMDAACLALWARILFKFEYLPMAVGLTLLFPIAHWQHRWMLFDETAYLNFQIV